MTEPRIDKVLRHVCRAVEEADKRGVSVRVQRALQTVLDEIRKQKDKKKRNQYTGRFKKPRWE